MSTPPARRERRLRVGLQLPQWGPASQRESLIAAARAAEAAGFDSVWVSDHLVYPTTGDDSYPYNATGKPPFRPEDGYLEALTMLAVIAGATESIRLGTSVLVMPLRPVLLTAKAIATLDVLSGGRVSLAVSAGWWRAEFEAVGADFEHRGEVLDAQLDAMHALWIDGRAATDGPYVSFPEVISEPRPVQAGGPDLWIGGTGRRVWDRIARHKRAGWHGIGYDADKIAAARHAIGEACATAGRDAGPVRVSTATGLPATADKMRARLDNLAAAEVDQVVFIPRTDTSDSLVDAIALFAVESARYR